MIQRERLVKDFEAMAQLTASGEGINRLAFTDADWAGRQYDSLKGVYDIERLASRDSIGRAFMKSLHTTADMQ